jgi:hypothetical protein
MPETRTIVFPAEVEAQIRASDIVMLGVDSDVKAAGAKYPADRARAWAQTLAAWIVLRDSALDSWWHRAGLDTGPKLMRMALEFQNRAAAVREELIKLGLGVSTPSPIDPTAGKRAGFWEGAETFGKLGIAVAAFWAIGKIAEARGGEK